jgi:hypothetical protein
VGPCLEDFRTEVSYGEFEIVIGESGRDIDPVRGLAVAEKHAVGGANGILRVSVLPVLPRPAARAQSWFAADCPLIALKGMAANG